MIANGTFGFVEHLNEDILLLDNSAETYPFLDEGVPYIRMLLLTIEISNYFP